jgi:hypothetical protein
VQTNSPTAELTTAILRLLPAVNTRAAQSARPPAPRGPTSAPARPPASRPPAPLARLALRGHQRPRHLRAHFLEEQSTDGIRIVLAPCPKRSSVVMTGSVCAARNSGRLYVPMRPSCDLLRAHRPYSRVRVRRVSRAAVVGISVQIEDLPTSIGPARQTRDASQPTWGPDP